MVVPTRDRPALLRECLTSIRRHERPGLELEILVADNGTHAETARIATSFGARYLTVQRRGPSAARNVALRAATGDYVAFLDDDDVWLPDHLEPHLRLLEARPDLGAVVGQVICTDPELRPITDPWPIRLPEDGDSFLSLFSYFPQVGATVVRASILPRVGLFDEDLLGDEDWDFHLRIATRYPVGFIAQPCILFRQRPAGSFDDLTEERLVYTRRVFLRHALAGWRRFESPRALLRAYNIAMGSYYNYYVAAASTRTRRGDNLAAARALVDAALLVPVTAARDLTAATPFRDALVDLVHASLRVSR